ncbi:hypothetical protein CHCC14821_3603 [Bacillus paralicheniformis]|nr:hypothetical protein CHCC14821_3603 [Bacillus paralicheniformis]TWM62407.1 hypothetical protein CHCC14814_1960 [Bacillus paralicheniformis]
MEIHFPLWRGEIQSLTAGPDPFVSFDGSIIGQPYLTEPMGEPSA